MRGILIHWKQKVHIFYFTIQSLNRGKWVLYSDFLLSYSAALTAVATGVVGGKML